MLAWFIILGLDTAVCPAASEGQAVVHAAAYDVTFRHMGNMRLLDALIRRQLPVDRDAQDADAPDAYYPYPSSIHPVISIVPTSPVCIRWCCLSCDDLRKDLSHPRNGHTTLADSFNFTRHICINNTESTNKRTTYHEPHPQTAKNI